MNILFLSPAVPYPPNQGGAIRTWGLLRGLARSHRVSLMAFSQEVVAERAVVIEPVLQAVCERVLLVEMPMRIKSTRLKDLLFSRQADLALRLYSPKFASSLQTWLCHTLFDFVIIEGLEMACYLPVVRQHSQAKIVFDAFNAETLIQQRAFETDIRQPKRWGAAFYSLLQAGRIQRFERAVCQQSDLVLAVSSEDQTLLAEHTPQRAVYRIPNGIRLADLAKHAPPYPFSHPTLLFTGKMDYRPNADAVEWFAHEIFPLVRAQVPDAEFWIVGKQPIASVRVLANEPGVVVTGEVPDTHPYLAGCAVYVAPLRMGGGTRLKLIEALAQRKAIVATTIGAEGFAFQNDVELLLAEDAPDFANAVLNLLAHPPTRTRLAEAGYQRIAAEFDWEVIVPQLEQILQEMMCSSL
ncbi:MAG TPA: glycosyltransferase [Anaerolineales bacterium]|nr:glycosyltransferase [Anaerolineales bacterium]